MELYDELVARGLTHKKKKKKKKKKYIKEGKEFFFLGLDPTEAIFVVVVFWGFC